MGARAPFLVRAALAVYRAQMRVLPAAFRRRFGDASAALFADLATDAWRRRGAAGVLGALARGVGDLLAAAVRWRWTDPMIAGFRRRRRAVFPGRGGGAADAVVHELRRAGRGLRRRPGFTVVVVVTVAVATGASTAIFGLVDAMLLRPLPYREAGRLYGLVTTYTDKRGPSVSWPDFSDFRAGASALDDMVAWRRWSAALTGDGEAAREPAMLVSDGFFQMLGIAMQRGRAFRAEEQRDGSDAVVVLSHGLWQRRYGGDPAIVGRSIEVGGRPHVVVGVAPVRFATGLPGIGESALWRPLGYEGVPADDLPSRGNESFGAIAHLRTGARVAQANAELGRIAADIARRFPESNTGQGVELTGLQALATEKARPALLLMLGAVALVLAIAVTNVTSLMLGRASDRARELAVCAALGAGRARLLGPALAEAAVLSVVGGGLGVALAAASLRWLIANAGAAFPLASEARLDVRVLSCALAVTAGAALLTGLATGLLSTSRRGLALHDGSARGFTAGTAHGRLRSGLVVMEVALSMMLVIAAGLVLRSMLLLTRVEPGFDDAIATFRTDPPAAFYDTRESVNDFYARLLERLSGIPGVESVATISAVPLSSVQMCGTLFAEEDPDRFEGQDMCAELRAVSRDYLRAMGIPLLRGRTFDDGDGPDAPNVVIVSESTARLLWPGRDAIGRRLSTGFAGELHEVVGIAADVKQFSLDERTPPQTYLPAAQWQQATRTVVVRAGDAASMLPVLRDAVREIDDRVPVSGLRTMGDYVRQSLAAPRFRTGLLAAFACVAMLLAVVGIYGVLAHSVNQRRREMAIRKSVGARGADVVGLVLGDGLRLAVLGVALGAAGALAAGGVLRGLLFGVTARDPAVFIAVPVLLLAVAAAASLIPALRAMRTDAMRVLREE